MRLIKKATDRDGVRADTGLFWDLEQEPLSAHNTKVSESVKGFCLAKKKQNKQAREEVQRRSKADPNLQLEEPPALIFGDKELDAKVKRKYVLLFFLLVIDRLFCLLWSVKVPERAQGLRKEKRRCKVAESRVGFKKRLRRKTCSAS